MADPIDVRQQALASLATRIGQVQDLALSDDATGGWQELREALNWVYVLDEIDKAAAPSPRDYYRDREADDSGNTVAALTWVRGGQSPIDQGWRSIIRPKCARLSGISHRSRSRST